MSRVARMPDFDASVFGSVRFFCDAKRSFGKGIRTAFMRSAVSGRRARVSSLREWRRASSLLRQRRRP